MKIGRLCGGRLLFGLCFLSLSGLVHATVMLQDSQVSSVAGQDFSFDFYGVPESDGGEGSLTFYASGDFVHSRYLGYGYESFTWSMEGLASGGPLGDFVSADDVNIDRSEGGPFDYVNYSGGIGNIEFQKTYLIGGGVLDSILSDGLANIFVDLGDGVSGSGNMIGVALSYSERTDVSEPVSLSLLGFGVLAVVSLRRKKKPGQA